MAMGEVQNGSRAQTAGREKKRAQTTRHKGKWYEGTQKQQGTEGRKGQEGQESTKQTLMAGWC